MLNPCISIANPDLDDIIHRSAPIHRTVLGFDVFQTAEKENRRAARATAQISGTVQPGDRHPAGPHPPGPAGDGVRFEAGRLRVRKPLADDHLPFAEGA